MDIRAAINHAKGAAFWTAGALYFRAWARFASHPIVAAECRRAANEAAVTAVEHAAYALCYAGGLPLPSGADEDAGN